MVGNMEKTNSSTKERWHNITAKYKSDGDEPICSAVP
jgi:hypothetical protein